MVVEGLELGSALGRSSTVWLYAVLKALYCFAMASSFSALSAPPFFFLGAALPTKN